MDLYLLKELYHLRTQQSKAQPEIMETKKLIIKYCTRFTNCITRKSNTQVDYAHGIDVLMAVYNLKHYSDNYSKTSGILCQYCKVQPAVDDNDAITGFNAANATTNLINIKA